MKIVFVIPDMPGGGTERVISLLANEYVSRGIEVDILLFAGQQTAYKLDERVQVVSVAGASGGSVKVRLKRLKNMRTYFKRNPGCRIFSFSTIGTGFVVLSTIGLKRRMLVSERIDPESCDHKAYRNFFYRFSDVLVCQTKEAASCFPKGIADKAVVIPNPLDSNLRPPYTGERKKWIVTVGRLEKQKNQKLLIEAFADFHNQFPDYSLHIYGKGELEEELKDYSRSFHMEQHVVFHGFCSNVHEEIVDSAMFVLSSDYEGISNSMAEAVALGIPVIATDCPPGGCSAYIENEKNGLLVPVGDRAALCGAMKRIASDECLARKLSENGVKLREKYPVWKIADAMLNASDKNNKRG